MKTFYPATQINPACETPEFARDCELEAKDLLCRDRIMELDFDGETLAKLYAVHKHDLLDLGEVIDRYFRGLADNQAHQNVKWEYEK